MDTKMKNARRTETCTDMWNSQYEKECQPWHNQYITLEQRNNIVVPLTDPDQDINLQGAEYMDGQVLKTGEKKDEGKPRWELLDYTAIEGIAKILTLGAKKYAARNWELGIHYGRVFGAVQRHLSAWWMGDSIDAESGLSHLDHAMCELMFLSAYEKRGMTGFDDRPNVKRATVVVPTKANTNIDLSQHDLRQG